MKVPELLVLWYSTLSYSYSFIIPNEIPTILSVVYSNIPPLKIGIDTRFGVGFRLGPHVDWQALIEIGPQTNTNPISRNGTIVRRQSLPLGRFERMQKEAQRRAVTLVKDSKTKKAEKEKRQKTKVGNIEFNKVPGIDDELPKTKPKNFKIVESSAEELTSPVKISLL